MVVLNLMLLLSWVPFGSSFVSTQSFVQNLNGWFVVSSNRFIIFWYSIIMYWYYNTNLRSSTFFFLNSGDIYFFLSIFLFVSKLFYDGVFEALLILSAISFPIHLTIVSAVLNDSFWKSFKSIYCRLFSMIKTFLTIFTV